MAKSSMARDARAAASQSSARALRPALPTASICLPRGRLIDAGDRMIAPGLIDPHVHFYGEGIGGYSRLAIMGGVTTFIGMIRGAPDEPLHQSCRATSGMAKNRRSADFSFHVVLHDRDDVPGQIAALARQGFRSFKMFLAYKRRGMMVSERFLTEAMAEIERGRRHRTRPRRERRAGRYPRATGDRRGTPAGPRIMPRHVRPKPKLLPSNAWRWRRRRPDARPISCTLAPKPALASFSAPAQEASRSGLRPVLSTSFWTTQCCGGTGRWPASPLLCGKPVRPEGARHGARDRRGEYHRQ